MEVPNWWAAVLFSRMSESKPRSNSSLHICTVRSISEWSIGGNCSQSHRHSYFSHSPLYIIPALSSAIIIIKFSEKPKRKKRMLRFKIQRGREIEILMNNKWICNRIVMEAFEFEVFDHLWVWWLQWGPWRLWGLRFLLWEALISLQQPSHHSSSVVLR